MPVYQKSGRRELCTGSCHLATLPNPSWLNIPAPLTPYHSLVLDLSQPSPGRRLGLAMQRQTGVLGCDLGGVEVATVSTCSGSVAGAPRSLPPSGANALAPPTPHSSLALELGQTGLGEDCHGVSPVLWW